jgi:hypothetical protein
MMTIIFLLILMLGILFSIPRGSKILRKQLCNAVAINMNQFKQGVAIGQLDPSCNASDAVMTLRYNPAGSGNIIPGEGLKLIDQGASDVGGVPLADKRTADADAIFGVKIFTAKDNTEAPGRTIEVARQGAVIWMQASAAIVRGAKVALVLATPGQVVTLVAQAQFGVALDKASGANVLIRVLVTAGGFV